MFLFCLVFAMFCARLFICALWSPAGKGLTSWLSFVVSSVSLSLSHWYPGSGVVLVVSIPDLCTITYFYIWPKSMLSVTPGKNCCIIKSMSSIIEFISLNIQITK